MQRVASVRGSETTLSSEDGALEGALAGELISGWSIDLEPRQRIISPIQIRKLHASFRDKNNWGRSYPLAPHAVASHITCLLTMTPAVHGESCFRVGLRKGLSRIKW